jgi:hypothetical protein
VRSAEEFDAVQHLIAADMNDCAIARQTGIPRRTVCDWRYCGLKVRARVLSGSAACRIEHDFPALLPEAYCYLLGLYLGDGCISRSQRVWHLRITLDKKYPEIIDRCCAAIDALFAGQRASISPRNYGCVDVSHYSKHWPCFFPQHGAGKKHLRPIRLEPWQELLVKQATEQFIRGLIDSDGCRVVANDRGISSVRYHFSNRSDDIRALFCGALDELCIPWTRPSEYQVAVYRKAAVARLDEFVGPKS